VYICVTQEDGTALMIAARRGHTNIVRTLLSNGADINLQDKVTAGD
jgi:ankyrin repeat protein